ncbi:phytanoyl-CoA dioxygenase family protein [Marinomonas sp.]|nr:phytanoyl-CoA dioxygenase family protein [Marinomonas sp.]MDB4836854.1 phytanoyl-CoA dioxygenase family protein [Marinomonas sp.]
MNSFTIKQEQIEQFQKEGATVIRGLFSDWVDVLREGVAANMANPNPDVRIYKEEDKGGKFFIDFCSWQRIPQYKDFIFNSAASEIAASLMSSKEVKLFHEHVLVKEAQSGIATPWHHDMPYYCVDGPKTISLWIPLDDVPKERTLEFIAGSHLWGKSFRPQLFNGKPLNENDGLEDIPDIEGNRESYKILGWDLKPGDAVAFDYRTLHGSRANNSPTSQRRAFSLRMVGENTTFARRENIKTSPPFNDVKLKHGNPLVGEEFPILFPKS